MPSPVAATPIAFIQSMVHSLQRGGRPPDEALRKAQIAPSLLRRDDARVTARQMERFAAQAMFELDDEGLGAFSRRLPWGSYGMLVRASISAPTLGVALKRWCRHHGLLTDDVTLGLELRGARARVWLRENRPLPAAQRELALLTLMRQVHGVACWLIDSRIVLEAVHFVVEAPPHADVYGLMFPGPVTFGAADCSLWLDTAWLALPLQRDEAALQQMLKRALPLTVGPYRRERRQAERVLQLLRRTPGQAHTADSIARALHLSVRSLHRQLADEGRSLQALKDDVRRDQAIELLCRSRRPIKQVAMAVGFASEKSFARAFRIWTGETPSGLRQRAGAAGL